MTKHNGHDREDLIKEIERLKEQRDKLLRGLESLIESLNKKRIHPFLTVTAEMLVEEIKESP